ncbi:MAG TPA: DinB family protein [Candidatus Dormibacteraeota bacterium]|nr:DinB family protein [Candidatus Dormibacteraeota bacterium]
MGTHAESLRSEAVALLRGVGAHMPFDEAVAGFPDRAINVRPPNVPYTPWQLLEHIRLTQRDILDYIRDRAYVAPRWPDDYWPAPDETADRRRFDVTLDGFRADAAELEAIVLDPGTDLLAPIPATPGHTILREVRLVADHNAYHIGELAILRQVIGAWPEGRRS